MGTDLFTSSRGPGVIGTLMALLVLGGFGTLYVFVFDESLQGDGKSLESIIADDAKQVVSLEKRVKSHEEQIAATEAFKDTASQILSQQAKLTAAEARSAELEGAAAERSAEIEKLEGSFGEYQQSYRESARASMVGKKMDELKTLEGTTYKDVKVTDVDPARMQIRHSAGITGIALEQLPEDMQDYLQVDASEKERLLAAEEAAKKLRNQSADFGEAEYKIAMMEHDLKGLDQKRKDARNRYNTAQASIPSLEIQISRKRIELTQEERKARSGGISNAPQVRSHIQQLESRMAAAQSKLPSLRADISKLDNDYRAMEQKIAISKQELKTKKAEAAAKKAAESKEES
ncbi:hypothetical protein HAHE_09290 [Haloferula helveola]|uniref:Chromosome partition protein Smc n=1 Tax=Haloferula helveola TaxID=490095 RepID=A0ABN6H0F3_9BACT|nr:hypothetical protein HAHE_09290 [Haloferula helveola]